jgi:hypothetical protein
VEINKKLKIANSFPLAFERAPLEVFLSKNDFELFKTGFYAGSMDDKWNAFVLDDVLFFARSWTDNCIFKIETKDIGDKILLTEFKVNRDIKQYKGTDIEFDRVHLLKLLQGFLKREDLYVDPKLELDLIKHTIEKEDQQNNYTKSIGSSTVGFIRFTYQSLIDKSSEFFEVNGWEDLENKLSNKNAEEPLISLYMQQRQNSSGRTFYFDKDADELLGEITIIIKGLGEF